MASKRTRKVYPTESRLLIAEQVRLEVHNKLSLVGWYAGEDIVFHPKPGRKLVAPYTAQTLAFVIVMKGGEGEFAVRFAVTDPHGKPLLKEGNLGTQTAQPTRAHIVAVQAGPVKFPSEGVYVVDLMLNKKHYHFAFNVAVSEKPLPENFAQQE